MRMLLGLTSTVLMIALAVFTPGQTPQADNAPKLPLALGVIHPRLSADGRMIAASYQGAIWIMPADGGVLRRLTDGDGFDHEPAWSPDGKTLAFVRGPNQPGGELKLIRADGSPVPLARPVQVKGTYNFQKLVFHPKEDRILGVLRSDGKDHGLAWLDFGSGDITSLHAALTSSSKHALSPDGQWIIYSTTMDQPGQQTGNDGPEVDLWKIPAIGGKAEKLVRFPCRVHDLCWHPDGQSLIVVSDLGGVYYDLWQLPLTPHPQPPSPEGRGGQDLLGGMKKLTAGQADEDRPSVSRDGKRLLYTDNRAGATTLVLRDLGTNHEQTVAIHRLDYGCPTGTLRLKVQDTDTKKTITARISLQQDKGKYFAPPGSLYRFLRGTAHFYADEVGEWTLPAGKYRLRAFRGPEYEPLVKDVTIGPGQKLDLTVEPRRWTNLAKLGWFSGENHIHANYGYGQWHNTPETMLAQCSGEDLNVCNLVVANSDTDGVFDRAYFRGRPDPRSTAETILYWNQEFRSTLWGHMTLVNLKQVVEPVFTGFHNTTNPWDIPTNSDVADRTHWQKGHVNYTHPIQNPAKPLEHPYAAKGLPIDVALGKIDSLDLNNSYVGTVPTWYRLLNCGFRLPPSAGTDCFLNRIFSQLPGGDRVYVQAQGPLSYDAWMDGLRKGRSFVTNGPMLELTADGRGLSEVIQVAGPQKVAVKARARAQFPLAKVELIQNGVVLANVPLAKDGLSASLDQTFELSQSGWLALRATGPGNALHPSPYAHTAPIYVEVAGAPVRSRTDAQFFLAWIDDLAAMIRTRDRAPTPELRRHIESQLDAARTVYGRIAREGK